MRAASVFSVLLFTACGCNSVEVYMPLNRLESPEAAGNKGNFSMGLGVGGTLKAEYTDDASARPLSLNNPPAFKESGESFAKLAYAPLSFIDFFIRADGLTFSPGRAGVKLQIIGQPAATAKKGNFSVAATAAGIFGYEYQSGDQKGRFGPGGYQWNSDLNVTGQDIAGIAGYRFSDGALLYASVYRAGYYSGGSIHQAASDDGTSGTSQFTFQGNGTVEGGAVGISFASPKASFTLEYAWARIQWSSILYPASPTGFGVGLDVRF